MTTVKQLLDAKGRHVWSVEPADLVYDAIKLMAEKAVGALVVLDRGNLVGIISERDYARNVILKGKSSRQTPVSEIMTRGVMCATPDQSVEDCMTTMTDKHIRHLPIIEGEQVSGMVSIGDLVKTIIDEQQQTIEQLGRYISG